MVNNSDMIKSWSTTKYLLKHEYLKSQNQSGIEFCEKYRRVMVLGYFASVSTVPIFLTSVFIFGWPPGWQ